MIIKGNHLVTESNNKESKYENVTIEFFEEYITIEAIDFSKITLSYMDLLEVTRVNIDKHGKKIAITVDSFLEEVEIKYIVRSILMTSNEFKSFLEMLSKNIKMDLTLVLSTAFGKTKYYMYSLKDDFEEVTL